MSKISSDQLVELIQKSKLVAPDAFDAEVAALLKAHDGQLPTDPVDVAMAFQRAELLTRWQCEKLLLGKHKGFFLGKHKLLGHLGTGGMSTVYLAEHTVMHHKRAIKVLPKAKLTNSSYLARFQREAKAIASMSHPNIVRAYDIDNEKDTHYLVMEYVEGVDLQTLVKRNGPVPYDVAADYIIQAAHGLQHSHDSGLIHRDVKPANLLVSTEGHVKVLDLGLALFADEEEASLTMDYNDKVLGTADYLAPEQALNSHNVDGRADIYGLGGTLYFLLTGHPPFPDGSIAQRIAKHQKIMPEEIRKDRPDCPGELEGICVKMLQKDPKFRYPNCTTVANVLEKWLKTYRENTATSKVSIGQGANGFPIIPSSGSDLSPTHRKAEQETVSNRASETLKGLQGGSSLSLSTSDSGVLRAIAARELGSTLDSRIDLEAEIAKRKAKGGGSSGIIRPTPAIRKEPPQQQKAGPPLPGKNPPATKPTPAKSSTSRPESNPTKPVRPHAAPSPKSKSKDSNPWTVWLLAFGIIAVLGGLLSLAIVISQYGNQNFQQVVPYPPSPSNTSEPTSVPATDTKP